MVEYDPKLCEDYVQRALDLGPSTFVCLWAHHAGLLATANARETVDLMIAEWQNMRPWNKQGVLFLMADHIDEIARKIAMEASRMARVQDPI